MDLMTMTTQREITSSMTMMITARAQMIWVIAMPYCCELTLNRLFLFSEV